MSADDYFCRTNLVYSIQSCLLYTSDAADEARIQYTKNEIKFGAISGTINFKEQCNVFIW